MDGRDLVERVHVAARAHHRSWEAMVPDSFQINFAAEAAEEHAYEEMAAAKRRLRDHICETYGLSIRELSSLAMP